jgi:hypothetical protein
MRVSAQRRSVSSAPSLRRERKESSFSAQYTADLFLLKTRRGVFWPQFFSHWLSADHTLIVSVFLHSTLKGNRDLACVDSCMSSPLHPMGVLRTSSSLSRNFFIIRVLISFWRILPLFLHEEGFICVFRSERSLHHGRTSPI